MNRFVFIYFKRKTIRVVQQQLGLSFMRLFRAADVGRNPLGGKLNNHVLSKDAV